MRQRVGLARALAVDADILLMDEPFASVDEQIRRKFQEDLLHLLSDENKTVIFVTHSIEEAVYVSDQVVILTRGPVPGLEGRPSRRRPQRRLRRASGAAPPTSTGWSRSGPSSRTTWRSDMELRGHRIPMVFSLLVWFVLWEVVGRLELVSLIPPFSEVLAAFGEVVSSSRRSPRRRRSRCRRS